MGNTFSSKPKLEITEADRAVLTLKTQRRRLQDQQKRVIYQIDRENAVARELVAAGRKDRALLALKKRRIQQTSLEKLDAWLLNVETMLSEVETAANQALLVAAMKQGNDALKQMQKAVSLDDVEKLMQDTADAAEYQQELQRMLGTAIWTGEDEAASEADLAALEAELSAELLGELPQVPKKEEEEEKVGLVEELELPAVPMHVPSVAVKTESARRPHEERVPAS